MFDFLYSLNTLQQTHTVACKWQDVQWDGDAQQLESHRLVTTIDYGVQKVYSRTYATVLLDLLNGQKHTYMY